METGLSGSKHGLMVGFCEHGGVLSSSLQRRDILYGQQRNNLLVTSRNQIRLFRSPTLLIFLVYSSALMHDTG
jgi:hypothetical protein